MTYKFSCCDDGSGATVGSVVRFDNVTLLIDPGWNPSKVSYEQCVDYWEKVIPEIDVIILSQPTAECLGAHSLLYYNFISHFISRIQVYATLPVINLGRVSTIDSYASAGVIGPYDTNKLDLEDIEKSFDHIVPLKYSQLVDLRSRFDGLTLLAYNAGVCPGGSIWCISTYSEKLIYAKRWNHTRDNILNAASILDATGKPSSTLMRPSAIITTLDRFGSSQPFKRRSKTFKDTLRKGLNSDGSVIIPVDMSGKFLDLFTQVHELLFESTKINAHTQVPVLILSYSRGRTLTYAKSMLEWLSPTLLKTWENRNNTSPFEIGSRVKIISPKELKKYVGSKICFVSEVEALINEVITRIGNSEKTTLILTKPNFESASCLDKILDIIKQDKSDRKSPSEEDKPFVCDSYISIDTIKEEPLSKEELEAFKLQLKEKKKNRNKKILLLKRESQKLANGNTNIDDSNAGGTINSQDILAGDADEEPVTDRITGEDEDEEEEEDNDNLLSLLKDNSQKPLAKKNTEASVDIIIQQNATSKHKMFPFNPIKIKKDDYGTVVDFTMFIPDDLDNTNLNSRKRPLKDGSKSMGKDSVAGDEDSKNEEDDGYNVGDPVSKKRKHRSSRYSGFTGAEETENFDNLDYLIIDKTLSKRIESTANIQLKCSVVVLNLQSLVDQRSASIIWPSLRSRKMVLSAPKNIQNEELIAKLTNKNIEVVNMPLNKTVEFNTTIKALDISIDSELDNLLKWQRISGSYTVATVVGRLVKETLPQVNNHQKTASRSKLVLKPLNGSSRSHKTGALSIGDVRLVQLKKQLTEKNYIAEFKGEGTLVINGKVAVRKINDAETIIDGTPSELFDTVKKLVTDMLAKI
ncbi:cleavage polyadenylation factor subunit CFT2 [Saccharomyces eubayanus]|uniref:cleavage polyadenylation factor subunit CFT2 n=1 Tax=Saccharomyces eubayanus TaxID=1080349 RepID=UPI0006C03CF1|nr:CFT2-like protein [Saccharomyces eubayanus]KOG97825.1 CFT2-like protein [Saccharomyces eubayanus]